MPYQIKKISSHQQNVGNFQVRNTQTGHILARHTTKAKAEAQIRLLRSKSIR
jgi:hypothetical protein